ncbi:MAG: 4Fe-4S dicluster domain-containing protein [Deltaproteobacteria bacterium]|nr:4Fe-4S dicluster domain-containing protein [Deltaproteobacteria bacterium]
MLISKMKEVWICLKAGRVTLPYPFKPAIPPDGFRGKLEIDKEKCIGCAGCANVCTPRAIIVTDLNGDWRKIDFYLERCTYCGRCEEVCPENAIAMTKEFETATNSKEDLHISVELYMGTCQRCGRCFTPVHPLDRLMVTGFREN